MSGEGSMALGLWTVEISRCGCGRVKQVVYSHLRVSVVSRGLLVNINYFIVS